MYYKYKYIMHFGDTLHFYLVLCCYNLEIRYKFRIISQIANSQKNLPAILGQNPCDSDS